MTAPYTTIKGVVISESDITFIAHTVHEANHAWCLRNGDHSQTNWKEAPDWQRNSAVLGVKFQLGRLDEPSNPAASHMSWSAQKIKEGWVYGEEKDPENKTHPCLVPFEELPPEQQFKDCLFETLVRKVTYELVEHRIRQAVYQTC